MRFRGKSIRRKIVALLMVPLVSLTALWGFATVLTGREADQLLDVGSVVEQVGHPVEDALEVIQKERRQTLVYLADRRASDALPDLRERRAATDAAVAKIKQNAEKKEVREDMRPDGRTRLSSLLEGLDGLAALRRSVEAGTVSRAQALEFYNRIVDPGFRFLTTLHALNDVGMERQGRALVGLVRAMEMLSREDALIASALTTGKVSADEIRKLSVFVANRELYYDINLEVLPAQERGIYEQYWRSPRDRGPARRRGTPHRRRTAEEGERRRGRRLAVGRHPRTRRTRARGRCRRRALPGPRRPGRVQRLRPRGHRRRPGLPRPAGLGDRLRAHRPRPRP